MLYITADTTGYCIACLEYLRTIGTLHLTLYLTVKYVGLHSIQTVIQNVTLLMQTIQSNYSRGLIFFSGSKIIDAKGLVNSTKPY